MGMISCYAIFGRRSKMARTVPVSTATKGMDEFVEAIKNLSKGDEVQEDCGSHLIIDCPISHDNALRNEGPGSKTEGVASGPRMDVAEIVVDIDNLSLSSFSATQHDGPANRFDELDGNQQSSNFGSSCSHKTCHGGASLGEGSSVVSVDGQVDGMSEAFPHIDRSPDSVEDHSYSDYADQSKLDQAIARSEDGRGDGLDIRHPIARSEDAGGDDLDRLNPTLLTDKIDGDELMSGHASDPGYVYAREHFRQSPFPSGDDKEFSFGLAADSCSDGTDSSLGRVKAWVNSIQLSDMVFSGDEEDTCASGTLSLTSESVHIEAGESSIVMHQGTAPVVADHGFQNAAVRSLHLSSTVAHISGIGLREVPPLGMFSSLRALNLSANAIARVPAGCLPQGLHSLDLSRNRIAQIEGFRELSRLRVLNLSYNRISRVGHGLANCTLIKELYLAGNKIAEVEGLHRLLKLVLLDLGYNKITTSKALGQLAANYGSLLALNLIGNPILTNFSEDQLRKLVTALAPHLTYLNRQPIKMVSVRGAALDSIAKAALGTYQRGNKSKAVKKPSGGATGLIQKKPPPHHHTNHLLQKKVGSASSSSQHRHHSSHHQQRPHARTSLKEDHEPVALSKLVGGLQGVALGSESRGMHGSKSAGVLQE